MLSDQVSNDLGIRNARINLPLIPYHARIVKDLRNLLSIVIRNTPVITKPPINRLVPL